jgi:hypothetical protein
VNPHIDPVYWWLTAATVPLWVSAVVWNWRAVRGGVLEGVPLRAATGCLATIYLAANLYLLFSDVAPQAWSDLLRGLGLLAIPIVWELPARFSVRMADRIRAADRRVEQRGP